MFGKSFIAILVLPIIPSFFFFFSIYRSEPVQHSEVSSPLIEMYDHSRILSKLVTLDNE